MERMKRRTRNYARRQLTWMRKVPNLVRVDRSGRGDAEVAAEIGSHLTEERTAI
jgi:tRNA dimethylallyltransferase